MNKFNSWKITLSKHPKKSVLLALFLTLAIGYKTGNILLSKLFSRFLSSMNHKLLTQMNEQFSNVEKYNRKLADLQSVTTNFEESQLGRVVLSSIFKSNNEIENLRKAMKKIGKDDPNSKQLKSEKFQQLCTLLFVQSVQCLQLFKPFYTMTYLVEVIFINEKDSLYSLLDKDSLIVLEVLQKLNKYLLESIYEEFTNRLLLQISGQEQFKYTKTMSLPDFFTLLTKLVCESRISFDRQKMETYVNELIVEKFKIQEQSVRQIHDAESLEAIIGGVWQGKVKCQQMANIFLNVAESESLKSYSFYCFQFQLRKLWNRYQILQQKSGNIKEQMLFSHLTNTNKILSDEIVSGESDSNNEKYYLKQLKTSFKLAFDHANQEPANEPVFLAFIFCKQLAFLYKINEERQQNELLKQTLNQFARKIMFGDEIDQKEDYEPEDKSNITDLLLQMAK